MKFDKEAKEQVAKMLADFVKSIPDDHQLEQINCYFSGFVFDVSAKTFSFETEPGKSVIYQVEKTHYWVGMHTNGSYTAHEVK